MGITLKLCDGAAKEIQFSLSNGDEQRKARIAAVTNEGKDLFITLGPGDHTSTRWQLSESLARKLRRELNERLD